MAIEKTFVKEGIRESRIENFLREKFKRAGYSRSEIHRTPIGMRIIVYANKPGLVIGRSGRRIQSITDEIKEKFGFENPLIDVRQVDNPFLDANIVASRVADSLERGINYKRVCNYYIQKIMGAGAIGVQIRASGKISGVQRSRFQKFRDGFIAHSGDFAEKFVDKGYAQANLRPGVGGIQVKIMREMPAEFIAEKELDRKIERDKELENMEKELDEGKDETKDEGNDTSAETEVEVVEEAKTEDVKAEETMDEEKKTEEKIDSKEA